MRGILRNNEENDWKEILSETLKELGFIDVKFEGKILVQVNQGGIDYILKYGITHLQTATGSWLLMHLSNLYGK